MFVLQARFAHEDPVLGAWTDENDALAAVNALDQSGLIDRLEMAECECDVDDLEALSLLEVFNDGVDREVWSVEGGKWLAENE